MPIRPEFLKIKQPADCKISIGVQNQGFGILISKYIS